MAAGARETALRALGAMRRNGAWSNTLLDSLLKKDALPEREAALAERICLGVLQNRLLLDFYIASFSTLKLKRIDPVVLDILELSVYQLVFLDRVPASAAVDEGVALAKAKSNPRAAGFVNALLRSVCRSLDALPEPPGSGCAYLSVKYSHPLPLTELLLGEVGADALPALLEADNTQAPVALQVNTLKINAKGALTALESEGARVEEHPWLSDCILLKGGAPERLETFRNGLVTVQDPAARLSVMAAAPKRGDRVLDACSAPGGKAFIIAVMMKNEGSVLACDLHEKKLPLIDRGAERLGIRIIETVAADASHRYDALVGKFNVVLADVPCSGLGVIRRKPEIRYKDINAFEGLPDIQLRIIRNIADYVAPGGVLLYSTCTVLKRENEAVISAFLAERSDFAPESFTLPGPVGDAANGMKTLWPQDHGTDGFFIAKLRRG